MGGVLQMEKSLKYALKLNALSFNMKAGFFIPIASEMGIQICQTMKK